MTESPHERTHRGARLVTAGILLSRIVGLVRQSLFGVSFGVGIEADAYNAASRIPNVLRNLLGEGAISASFVPVYAAALERGDEKGARALANALLGVLLAGVAVLTIVGITLAPVLTALLMPDLNPETAAITTRLLPVMFPMTGLMVLSGWCLGVQNANRRFFISYASAVMWSVPQIVLLLAAGAKPDLTRLVWWFSWATLAGAVLQVATQLPQVTRLMTSIRPSFNLNTQGLRETLRNFLPVVVALGVFQVAGLIDQFIASYLPDGTLATMGYATTLYLLPLSLFGVAAAAAALPELARAHARGERHTIAEGVMVAWERALFYIIPSAMAFIGIGDFIVGLLYRGGRFGGDEQSLVHFTLAGYAVGLVGYASVRVLTSAYQAVKDYRTPVLAACAGIGVSALCAVAIAIPFREHRLAVAGLAAGSAIGAYVNFAVLWTRLRTKLGAVDAHGPRQVAARALIASSVALVACMPIRWAMHDLPVRVNAAAAIPVYCVVFILVAQKLRLDEAGRLLTMVRRRVKGA